MNCGFKPLTWGGESFSIEIIYTIRMGKDALLAIWVELEKGRPLNEMIQDFDLHILVPPCYTNKQGNNGKIS
nr:hypothetical protein HmN_000305400 [Hymenolepis microstoma]